MNYPLELYSTCAFIGFLMCMIPFPWHLHAWNTGTCLYMFWVGLSCLSEFINSVVWKGHARNVYPVWCDISTRILIAASWGVPAASLCINRQLYHISKLTPMNNATKSEKRRKVIIELFIGLGLPTLVALPLYFVTQGHRFNIMEDVGCLPALYFTPASLAISCPPIIIGLISMFFGLQSIWRFRKSKAEFTKYLTRHNKLTASRYVRLMCLAGVEVTCTVPMYTYVLARNISLNGFFPYISWENVHYDFSRVVQYPALIWTLDHDMVTGVEFTRWNIVICAFLFFGFFGFSQEAMEHYRAAANAAAAGARLSVTSVSKYTSWPAPDRGLKAGPVIPTNHQPMVLPPILDVSTELFGSGKLDGLKIFVYSSEEKWSSCSELPNSQSVSVSDLTHSSGSPTPSANLFPRRASFPCTAAIVKANTHDVV